MGLIASATVVFLMALMSLCHAWAQANGLEPLVQWHKKKVIDLKLNELKDGLLHRIESESPTELVEYVKTQVEEGDLPSSDVLKVGKKCQRKLKETVGKVEFPELLLKCTDSFFQASQKVMKGGQTDVSALDYSLCERGMFTLVVEVAGSCIK